jgi:hypothetical protein
VENFLKVGEGLDVTPLVLALRRQPDLWREDTYLRDYPQGPFGDTETVILRFQTKRMFELQEELDAYTRGESKYDIHECHDTPSYAKVPEARPIVMNLMAYVQGERLGRVLINKIRPGGKIFPHADTPIHAQYWDRFHVALETSPGVYFRCGDEDVYMPKGTIWWFDNEKEHEVINNSANDRIHMVVDIRTRK